LHLWEVSGKRLVRGKTISTVLAAAAYIACREMGVSKTLKDISAADDIDIMTFQGIIDY
jgi:transcription initiation factor TFIIIB Brf1 subunit/transcription initiation factor TFIIB